MNIQNWQQQNGTLLTVNQQAAICIMIQLSFQQLVTGNITVTRTIGAAGDNPV